MKHFLVVSHTFDEDNVHFDQIKYDTYSLESAQNYIAEKNDFSLAILIVESVCYPKAPIPRTLIEWKTR